MRGVYNKGFKKKRNKYSVHRSSTSMGMESTAALNIVRVVVLLLMLGVVVATVTIGVKSFKNETNLTNSSQYKSETEQNELLLRVVNKSTPLDGNYVPELVEHTDYSVNILAEKPLNNLLRAAGENGINLSVDCAYVSFEEQDKLYKKTYNKYRKSSGLSQVKAQAKTETKVPQAGRSEFQTGLLIRFKTDENKNFKDTTASRWLERNSVDYGFVLRYPEGKTAQTSMSPDFASYRYVGEDNAYVMRSLGKTFNEYSYYIASR
ncbi:MAG: M15 family metallopeptidase [Ruminococcus sp.]|nr:M15 family metallopeptidase [Ruminococcus sp.]